MNYMKLFSSILQKKLGLFFWKFCDGKLIDGFGPDGISSLIKKFQSKLINFKVDLFINMLLLCY